MYHMNLRHHINHSKTENNVVAINKVVTLLLFHSGVYGVEDPVLYV